MHNRLQNHFRTETVESRARSAAAALDEAVANFSPAETFTQRAARSMASHPAIAIGAAFAVGLLVGKWVKR